MKRVKESGSSYRKKRKEREENLKKQENAIFRHFPKSNDIAGSTSSVNNNDSRTLPDPDSTNTDVADVENEVSFSYYFNIIQFF